MEEITILNSDDDDDPYPMSACGENFNQTICDGAYFI